MLFEFWEKVDRKDSLVGVARIPLHQYYLAFRNPTILKYLDRNQLPVIGTDWFEPISDPSTGAITGQAQILVALGSEAQIQCLETERGFKDNIVKRAQRIIDRPIRAQPDRSRPIRDDLDTCRGCNLHSSGVSRRSQALQNAISGRGAHKENKGRSQSLEEHNTGRSLVLEGTSGRSQVCESTSGRGQGLEEAIVGRSQGTSGRSQVCESTSGRSQGFEEAIVGRSQTTSGRSQVCENTTGRSQGFEETTVGRSQVLEGTSRGRSQVCEDKTGRSQGFEEALVGRSQLLEGTCARSPVLEGSSGRSQVGTAGRSQIIEGESGRSQEEERLKGQFKCILSRDVSEIIISEEFTTRKTGNNEDKQPEVVTDSVCRKLDETFCLETEVTQPETGSEKRTISVGTQSNEVSVVSDVVKLDKGTNKVLTYDRACQSDKMDQSKSDVLESLLQQLITHRPSSTTHEASTNTDPSATPNPAPKRKTTDLLNTLQRALTEPKDSFKARIRIDSALHLPSRKKCKAKKKGKASREEILPSTYVTFDSCQDVKITQIVHRNVNPKWEFSCDVSLPTELLTSNQKRLIFKVWKKGRNGGQEPNQQVDSVLGFAALDLTVLVAGLPTVHGWFNILDFSGKCNGQIKISLTPLEEIDKKNLTTTPTATKTPTPTLAPPLEPQSDLEPLEDPEPQETLSRALKRKFTELDEITQRLRSRLSNVTSNEESDASNDEVADEFEQDINTLCIEDDYDMIDFVREAQDMNLMRVSHSLQRLQQTAPEDNQTLIFSSDDYNPSEPSDTSSDLDKQLIEGKQRIDTLLEKLSIGGFGGRFVSGCSDAGGSADAPRQEEILKELGIEREFDARGLFDSKVFGELGGVRHAPDADYNVKIRGSTCGAVISKSERFLEPKSPICSDNGSVKSINSTPCFRTPTLPKKKKSLFSSLRKPKPAQGLFPKNPTDLEALHDKTVECANKDLYISDLTDQIEDMKLTLSDLTRQQTQVARDRDRHLADLADLKQEHRIVLQKVYLDHDIEIEELRKRLRKLEIELLQAEEELRLKKLEFEEVKETLQAEVITTRKEGEEKLKALNVSLQGLQEELKLKEQEKLEYREILRGVEEGFEEKLEEVKASHREEIRELEFGMLKAVMEMQALLDKEKEEGDKRLRDIKEERLREVEELTSKFEVEKGKLVMEGSAKLKQVEENSKEVNLLAEIQMQEKFEDLNLTWKLRLEEKEKESEAILKECQAISEYNIIQSELEKQKLQVKLDEKLKELEEATKANAELTTKAEDLSHKVVQIEEDLKYKEDFVAEVEGIKAETAELRLELQEVLAQKKIYEITISNSHLTIETLKKRLLDSDRFVEQLTEELEVCERSKLETEASCNDFAQNLEDLTRRNQDLQENYQRILATIEEERSSLQSQLLQKIEDFKLLAQREIDDLKLKLDLKENELASALTQLSAQTSTNLKAQQLISDIQNTLDEDSSSHDLLTKENEALKQQLEACRDKEEEYARLEKAIVQLQEKSDSYSQYCEYYKGKSLELEKELGELEGINKKYIEQSGRYDRLLQEVEGMREENAELERRIEEQEKLIGPFRAQLEAYEAENSALLTRKSAAESEARDVGLKYAQLLGHQNQKQKIRHLMDLKAQNFSLNETNKEMEIKVKAQARTIERLKKELAGLTNSPRKAKIQDKENLNSPNRTLNGTLSSPGPLRERN